MERKLATIERILDVQPAQNSDNLDIVKVRGWQVVTKRGQFSVGDLCIYIEIDSVLPEGNPTFEFMRERKFRVKTIKLRSNLSQGLIFPLSILPNNLMEWEEGEDLTKFLQITKYELPIPAHLSGKIKGVFPGFLVKTDSERIQNISQSTLDSWLDKEFYATEKLDGTSFTCYKYNNIFGVCSRNLELYETEDNLYWQIARRYKLEELIPDGICLQGEIIGRGVQKNKYDLKKQELFLFSIYNIEDGNYLTLDKFLSFCEEHGLQHVPLLSGGFLRSYSTTIEGFLEYAKGTSLINSNTIREGVVFARTSASRHNFKAINNDFLLRYE